MDLTRNNDGTIDTVLLDEGDELHQETKITVGIGFPFTVELYRPEKAPVVAARIPQRDDGLDDFHLAVLSLDYFQNQFTWYSDKRKPEGLEMRTIPNPSLPKRALFSALKVFGEPGAAPLGRKPSLRKRSAPFNYSRELRVNITPPEVVNMHLYQEKHPMSTSSEKDLVKLVRDYAPRPSMYHDDSFLTQFAVNMSVKNFRLQNVIIKLPYVEIGYDKNKKGAERLAEQVRSLGLQALVGETSVMLRYYRNQRAVVRSGSEIKLDTPYR